MEPTDRTPRVVVELGVPRYVWIAVTLALGALIFFLVTIADEYQATQVRARAALPDAPPPIVTR